MEQTKKQKTIRIVGFIALTILIVVGVILTIYFVQKADEAKNPQIDYIKGQINQKMESNDCYFTVTNFKTLSIDEQKSKANVQVEVKIEARQDMNLSITNFALDSGSYVSQEGFKETLEKDEILTFELNYVVKLDNSLLYLIYKNFKIALGEVQI